MREATDPIATACAPELHIVRPRRDPDEFEIGSSGLPHHATHIRGPLEVVSVVGVAVVVVAG